MRRRTDGLTVIIVRGAGGDSDARLRMALELLLPERDLLDLLTGGGRRDGATRRNKVQSKVTTRAPANGRGSTS